MFCSRCGKEIANGTAFCPFCGNHLQEWETKMFCSRCGKEVANGTAFCPFCGHHLAASAFAPAPTHPKIDFDGWNKPAAPRPPRPPMPDEKIDSWLAPSIVATVLCCAPFGIVAIVYAACANAAYSRGDYALAKERAETAKTWFWLSFILGLAGGALYFLGLVNGTI